MLVINLNYCIVKNINTDYIAIIVGLSRNSLTDYFDEISSDLTKKNIKGKVLLDYYNYNHSQKRRFFEADFKDNLSVNLLRKVNSKNLQGYINNFYSKTPSLQKLLIK